jgi:putative ATPase
MASLFDSVNAAHEPLAARMRPQTLADFIGQDQLVGENSALREMIAHDDVPSLIFWGPPGTGKTTLAEIIAAQTKAHFIRFSAVTSGIKEIRDVMKTAEGNRQFGERTIVFVDEIHRFNKAQQDAFLPFVEKGSITLIGATTENPSFEINSALLSRCKVFVLHPLTTENITAIIQRAIASPAGLGPQKVQIDDDALQIMAEFANGDARIALNTLAMAVLNSPKNKKGGITLTKQVLVPLLGKKSLLYDKKGEEHYNIISALHKSMRNSDPDAAVYWLARMLEGGEDPLYVARRLIRFASEDIGLADSRALEIAVAAYQAAHFIGMPECSVNLTQCVIYLSLAPKSNAAYTAYDAAKKDAQATVAEPVPLQLRNAPTKLMADLHYGENYQYAHSTKDKITNMQTMPDNLVGHHYYHPTDQGSEVKFAARLAQIEAWHAKHDTDSPPDEKK